MRRACGPIVLVNLLYSDQACQILTQLQGDHSHASAHTGDLLPCLWACNCTDCRRLQMRLRSDRRSVGGPPARSPQPCRRPQGPRNLPASSPPAPPPVENQQWIHGLSSEAKILAVFLRLRPIKILALFLRSSVFPYSFIHPYQVSCVVLALRSEAKVLA